MARLSTPVPDSDKENPVTCIVAIETPDGVWLGCDSQIGAWSNERLSVPKFCEVAPGVVVGVAGAWRMANILRHRWKPMPPAPGVDLDEWMFDSMEDIRRLLNEHGASKHDNSQQCTANGDSQSIVVVRGRAYSCGSCFSFFRPSTGYTAIGSGEPFALGSLATTRELEIDAESRVRLALESAERHNNGVLGPFTVKFVANP